MKFKSASSNPQVTSSNPWVASSNSRLTRSNPRVASSNLGVASSNPRVTSSNPRVIKSMKTLVSSLKSFSFLKIGSHKLFGNSWGHSYIQFLMIISCLTFPPLRLQQEAEWVNINFNRRDLNFNRRDLKSPYHRWFWRKLLHSLLLI